MKGDCRWLLIRFTLSVLDVWAYWYMGQYGEYAYGIWRVLRNENNFLVQTLIGLFHQSGQSLCKSLGCSVTD